MLVLSRKKNEAVVINENIRIEILQIKGKQIRLGITAPPSMKILRGELPLFEETDDSPSTHNGNVRYQTTVDADNRSRVMEAPIAWSNVPVVSTTTM